MGDKKENKKPDVTIIVVNFVKDLAKDWVKKAIFTAIFGFLGWAGYTIQATAEKYTSLPDKTASLLEKYEALLVTRSQDSAKAMKHLREDSLNALAHAVSFTAFKHKVDSALYDHARWLQNDLDSIIAINKKLTKHKIK